MTSPFRIYRDRQGHKVEIFFDDYPENPRKDFPNLGKLLILKKSPLCDLADAPLEDSSFTDDDFVALATAQILKLDLNRNCDELRVSIDPPEASYPWSPKIGMIFVRHDQIEQEYGEVTPETIKLAESVLRGELEMFNHFINGRAFFFVRHFGHGKQPDSCGGFYGDNFTSNGLFDAADIEANNG